MGMLSTIPKAGNTRLIVLLPLQARILSTIVVDCMNRTIAIEEDPTAFRSCRSLFHQILSLTAITEEYLQKNGTSCIH